MFSKKQIQASNPKAGLFAGGWRSSGRPAAFVHPAQFRIEPRGHSHYIDKHLSCFMNAPVDTDESLLSIQDGNQEGGWPPKGLLAILPTKAETEARFKPIQAFITTVSATSASHALKY